ncbi:MAG: hypothetical protein ABW042_08520 [Phenylobacterium sp.]
MSLTENYAGWLRKHVAETPNLGQPQVLNLVLRRLAQWRSRMLVNTFVHHHGLVILEGPFQGMLYTDRQTEGALLCRLFGSYESELHPHLARFAAEGLDCVIDIGCAEGYYAVGLARLMPQAVVHAHDIDEKARVECALLAERNGVADRVKIGGLFAPAEFEGFADRRCLVICDTEGAEDDLLDPAVSPALAGMRLIVETHEMFRPGVIGRLTERFAATHHIVRVDHGPKTTPLPAWAKSLTHLDHLLAYWEWRSGPTPWLVMTPKV